MPPLTKSRRQTVLWAWVITALALALAVVIIPLTNTDDEGVTSTLHRQTPTDAPAVVFTEVSSSAGIEFRHFSGTRSNQLPEDMGSGLSWCDYDGDGDLDLFAANISGPFTSPSDSIEASKATCALFSNDGDGTFTDVTHRVGLDLTGFFNGCAWADYDRDGLSDLIVSGFGVLKLMRQSPDHTFADVSQLTGVAGWSMFWAGVSWGDYDRDGFLDLYVCGYVRYTGPPKGRQDQYGRMDVPGALNPSAYTPERNLLFHNDGEGVFTQVAESAGVSNPKGRSLGAVWADFDDDGWLDLYVANDVSDNALFRNMGNGSFSNVSLSANVADYRGAMGLAVGDDDHDGDLDMVVTHWLGQENAVYRNWRVESKDSSLRFVDVADQIGLGQMSLPDVGWGVGFLDIDLDGWDDILIVNGSTLPLESDRSLMAPQNARIYWNRGPVIGYLPLGVSVGELVRSRVVARGMAVGDYDGDGDDDAAIMSHGEGIRLWRNDQTTGGAWLSVELEGTNSPKDGEGAIVTVVTDSLRQTKLVGGNASYLSGPTTRLVFGLGSAAVVDTLRVKWSSGFESEMTDLPINSRIVAREGVVAAR